MRQFWRAMADSAVLSTSLDERSYPCLEVFHAGRRSIFAATGSAMLLMITCFTSRIARVFRRNKQVCPGVELLETTCVSKHCQLTSEKTPYGRAVDESIYRRRVFDRFVGVTRGILNESVTAVAVGAKTFPPVTHSGNALESCPGSNLQCRLALDLTHPPFKRACCRRGWARGRHHGCRRPVASRSTTPIER
jgi:hypothetical protein